MKLLFVEDLEDDQRAVTKVLQAAGHSVDVYANAEMASAITDDKLHTYDIAVIDHQLPGETGLELGKRLICRNPQLLLIMLTAYTDAEKKLGAQYGGFVAFVAKPNTSEVVEMLNALKPRVEERRKLFQSLSNSEYGIFGCSKQIQLVRQLIATIGPAEIGVLILGESGTGKELVAKGVHYSSGRSSKNIVCINCAAIPENLLESELFGHERGAFTGATAKREGKVKMADEGTLFLDEIAEMSKDLQAKLLRFLQDGSFTPVGSNQEQRVDVRLIAATNKNIRQAISEGKFREDLFYRVNKFELNLPPLRDREGDVLVLAQHFLNIFTKAGNKLITGFSEAAEKKLISHQWPGNIRELESAIERAVIVEITTKILPSSLPDFNVTAHSTTVSQIKTTPIATSVDAKELYWQSLVKTRLDEFEAAFPQALVISQREGSEKVRLEDLGKALNPSCSHVVLSNFFNDQNNWKDIPGATRLDIIKALAKMHPDQWPHLRSDCGRLKKHFL